MPKDGDSYVTVERLLLAPVFSAANLALLARRIAIEDRALAPFREA